MEQKERIMTTIHDNDLKWLLGEGGNQLVGSIDEPDGWISRMRRIGFKPTVSPYVESPKTFQNTSNKKRRLNQKTFIILYT
jgi:hypothetical protein